MGECFFWYRPTRVVSEQRQLNGCVCVCVNVYSVSHVREVILVHMCNIWQLEFFIVAVCVLVLYRTAVVWCSSEQ